MTQHIKAKIFLFLKENLKAIIKAGVLWGKKFKTDNQKITEASYKVSYHTALAGEAHVIGESLIKHCVQDIVSCVLGESYSKQVESVSLSNNTVKKCINDIANDIELELISQLQACNAYALQLDESTDVAGLAILLVIVRYDFNKKIEEDLLLCESVNINTIGKNIFNCIDNFMTTHEINWGKYIEVCSDGAKAMTGKVSGVVAWIKNV
ncbi:Zinc finger BED domain-containing protein 5 [Araneus ventricosus]|uniref:Zinc finger BED domain-containing protein 5 n=1 Tax=Araneus ventricosus TaxID=182803 RepID=A0A4Y2UFP2_ARAVE|nr:Zinc finger BED domain-containing protein 5 [Araneus ventricosus]